MAIVQDDFSPIYQGDTGAPFAPQFLHKDGSVVDLTGCTITMQMKDISSGNIRDCTGAWTIDNASQGQAHYAYTSTDVGTPGNYDMIIMITKNSEPVHADEKVLEIKAL